MNNRFPALLLCSVSTLFAGCGRNEADVALNRMHEKYLQQMSANVGLLEQPEVGSIESNLRVQTSPIADVFEGKINLAIDAQSRYDVRSRIDPIADVSVTILADADAPAGTFGVPDGKKREKAVLHLRLLARSTARTLLLQIPVLEVHAPVLPSAFVLPATVTNTWYSMPFDEINASLREQSGKGNNEPGITSAEDLISNMFVGTRVSSAAMERAFKQMHMWKGLDVLPEENGNLQIRVVSDKKKILRSVKAALAYVKEVSGPSWEAQMKSVEFQDMVYNLRSGNAEFLSTMGEVRGVLSVEKETYCFRGFDGDIIDESGTVTGQVAVATDANGNVSFSISNTAEGNSTLRFVKNGDSFSFTADEKELAKGTWKDKSLVVSLFEENSDEEYASLTVQDLSYDPRNVSLSEAKLWLRDEEMTITVSNMKIAKDEVKKEASLIASFSVESEKQTVAVGSFASIKKESEPFTLEKPEHRSFEELQAELYEAILGGNTLETETQTSNDMLAE